MSESIIKVENLAKRFIISHEAQEAYNSLRDVVTHKVKMAFSFGKGKKRKLHTNEEFWALKDLNFEIKQGDRVGIIGRNGAGKSTLLKILSRITEPTSGRVTIDGRVASLLEVGTGFHPELTGRENIFLNGAILGMSRAEIRSKFDEIVDFAEVEQFLDTPVKRYSSGMYVRLAFAVAAHLEPEILIVDEVLAVGDAQFQKKCLGKMEDVSKNEGRTVLFVSHNMGIVSQLCKTAIYLRNGQVVEIDSAKNVINNYILNSVNKVNVYNADNSKSSNAVYVKSLKTLNERNKITDSYQFDDSIILDLTIISDVYNPAVKISITLQNNMGDHLSTIVSSLSSFERRNDQFDAKIRLEPKIIAPNSYTFRIAIFIPNGFVYDMIEMVCPIKIFDNGTEMALFEGMNYGSFFLNYEILKE